ncbi:transposase [Streptomyces malaysiensis]|uniref:transposase n=1 Tax=Streptomyces malaysiensis TaxID=92644 RepID=UPI003F885A82
MSAVEFRTFDAPLAWLTVYQLPPYAPDLNPVKGIWSVLRRTTTANRAFADPPDLINAVRRGLHQLQYRHNVLDGCLTGTRLVPTPEGCHSQSPRSPTIRQ